MCGFSEDPSHMRFLRRHTCGFSEDLHGWNLSSMTLYQKSKMDARNYKHGNLWENEYKWYMNSHWMVHFTYFERLE
jgi:hypothetical protein